MRTLLDVVSEPNGCKGFPDIGFNAGLFEVVIDLEKESGGSLLLGQGFEASGMPFQNAK
jgi:hypothetical protein